MNEQYYIVRSVHAGVFFGKIKNREKDEVTMEDVRRIWYWDGAASITQIAMEGVKKPGNCKFTIAATSAIIFGVIEIIPCTAAAAKNIMSVPEWKM